MNPVLNAFLAQYNIHHPRLTPLAGYTNYVFKLEQDETTEFPPLSVIRMANQDLAPELCPLAYHAEHIIRIHQQVAALGIAPEVLAFDSTKGIMWLAYAGQRQALSTSDHVPINQLLKQLHMSGLDWSSSDQVIDIASLKQLKNLAQQDHPELSTVAQQLVQLAQQRGYEHYPICPIHSDLNAGNWLHHQGRWYLVDWDFARMGVAEWDYASLVVEHGWKIEEARDFMSHLAPQDLAWFCAAFALLSWEWHVQRQTEQVPTKRDTTHYWLALAQ